LGKKAQAMGQGGSAFTVFILFPKKLMGGIFRELGI
jgi:hypothetical protein